VVIKKFSNAKVKLKQKSSKFSLEFHEDIRWNCTTKVLATVGYRYCAVPFQSNTNTDAGE